MVLTSLGRLARLTPQGNTHLPTCLPLLAGLEELSDQALASVNEAVQQLARGEHGWVGVAAAVLLERCTAALQPALLISLVLHSPVCPHPSLPLLPTARVTLHAG